MCAVALRRKHAFSVSRVSWRSTRAQETRRRADQMTGTRYSATSPPAHMGWAESPPSVARHILLPSPCRLGESPCASEMQCWRRRSQIRSPRFEEPSSAWCASSGVLQRLPNCSRQRSDAATSPCSLCRRMTGENATPFIRDVRRSRLSAISVTAVHCSSNYHPTGVRSAGIRAAA